jgi:hypothetical protein
MSRKEPTEAERAALRAWIAMAETRPGEALPNSAVSMLLEIAKTVHRLATPDSGVRAKRAAEAAAFAAGLTGRAIADFRAEQCALLTTMCLEFNRHQPGGIGKTEHVAKDVSNVSGRQVFRRLARSRKPHP